MCSTSLDKRAVPQEPILHHRFVLQEHQNTASIPHSSLPGKLIPALPFLKAVSTRTPAPGSQQCFMACGAAQPSPARPGPAQPGPAVLGGTRGRAGPCGAGLRSAPSRSCCCSCCSCSCCWARPQKLLPIYQPPKMWRFIPTTSRVC